MQNKQLCRTEIMKKNQLLKYTIARYILHLQPGSDLQGDLEKVKT